MKQQRLNSVMLLHTHKELTDELDMMACGNEFVSVNQHRVKTFGKFE